MDNQEEFSSSLTGKVFIKGVGLVVTVFGVGGFLLIAGMAYRLISTDKVLDTFGVVFILILLPIVLFCLSVGYRLTFNRPNKYGSLLSPKAWRVLGSIFLVVTLVFVVIAIKEDIYEVIIGAINSAIFTVWCFKAAKSTEANNAEI